MAACATATKSEGDSPSSSRNRLFAEDLVGTNDLMLYDALMRLRPMWLQQRGPTTALGPTPLVVYVDNIRAGTVEFLHNIPVETVREVQYINAGDATTRWGTGVAGGVILVISRPGG
jgi:hypothetical protein